MNTISLRYNISWTVESYAPIETYKLTYRMLQSGQSKTFPLSNTNSFNNIHPHDDPYKLTNLYNNELILHERFNDNSWSGLSEWREFIIQGNTNEYNHNFIQRVSHLIRNLQPDQYYEAKVMSR